MKGWLKMSDSINTKQPKGIYNNENKYDLSLHSLAQVRWHLVVLAAILAGLVDLKFHDLRRTFCSLLAQNGVSTAVTQRLLEHSSPNLTNKVYTNVDPVLRHAVEQLPVGKWL